jgi:putative nucleotidyltransferase with HDIG domain
MKLRRLGYRIRQLWNALHAAPTPAGLAQVRAVLTAELMALFLNMQLNEQAHSIHVMQQLLEAGETDDNLLAAALLHDVGKSRFPLTAIERMWIVLAKKALPGAYRRWSQGETVGWRRPFVVAGQHPAWGAEMAARCGASPQTIALIRRHQDTLPAGNVQSHEDDLLRRLQQIDDES